MPKCNNVFCWVNVGVFYILLVSALNEFSSCNWQIHPPLRRCTTYVLWQITRCTPSFCMRTLPGYWGLYSVCLQQEHSSKLIALYWCCHEWSHYYINSEVNRLHQMSLSDQVRMASQKGSFNRSCTSNVMHLYSKHYGRDKSIIWTYTNRSENQVLLTENLMFWSLLYFDLSYASQIQIPSASVGRTIRQPKEGSLGSRLQERTVGRPSDVRLVLHTRSASV